MINLEILREEYLKNGYSYAEATAKICHDILLEKISKSKLKNNITIKGGVVMYSLSSDKRRATKDLDLDFINYSISDKSVRLFINELNLIKDGIEIFIKDDIEELHHEDYNGKRLNVVLKDKNNMEFATKLDVGVHKNLDIKQDEYYFYLETFDEQVILMINSKEQIICEKIKSLLKFGIRNTRYKDIFDIYYLLKFKNIDKEKLLKIIDLLIIANDSARENSLIEIINNISIVFNNKYFIGNLSDARNNWLGISVEEVTRYIIAYFNNL